LVRRVTVVPYSHPFKIKLELDHYHFKKMDARSSPKVTAKSALVDCPVCECRLFAPKVERPPDYQVEVHWANEEKCCQERKSGKLVHPSKQADDCTECKYNDRWTMIRHERRTVRVLPFPSLRV